MKFPFFLLFFAGMAAAGEGNLIFNGSFELGTDGFAMHRNLDSSKNPDLKFKEVSRPIRLGFKAARLMFLHTTAWDDKNPVGAYRVEYESGNVLEIPLAFGENIGGWWNPSSQKLSSADCGWTVHDGKRLIGAFLFNWKNPRPQDPIRSVTLRSNGKTVIGLLGLTAERAR